MPDTGQAYRWTTPPSESLDSTLALRGLTVAETQEFVTLRTPRRSADDGSSYGSGTIRWADKGAALPGLYQGDIEEAHMPLTSTQLAALVDRPGQSHHLRHSALCVQPSL